MALVMGLVFRFRIAFAAGILSLAPIALCGDAPVAKTPYFVFHSDFDTNLNDALLVAGKARTKERPELFQSGDEQKCFDELAPSARAGWNLAVDFYARIISTTDWNGRQQVLLRYDLAGLEGRDDERAQQFLAIVRGFLTVASPAYNGCRWKTQDEENRSWVADLIPRLEKHAAAIAPRLEKVYATPLHGLPIRVDVVAHAPSLGASTWILDPGGHILISTSIERRDALETIFHETSHTLMAPWRPDPVPKALADASKELDVKVVRDLWHIVLFYTTGSVVRSVLEESGEPPYTPYMYEHGLWRGSWAPYRDAIEATWPAYLNGERTLEGAARDLIRAFRDSEPKKSSPP